MFTVATPTVAITGSADRFPVRRIFCVGQNYADHTREMGGDPDRQAPFFFTKPADAVVDTGADLPFPPQTHDLHYEVELVIALHSGGSDIAVADAIGHIFGHAVGIDLTRRDLQAAAKAAVATPKEAATEAAAEPKAEVEPASEVEPAAEPEA